MKLLLPLGLLALAISLCNLGKPKGTADIRPLFNVIPLTDQGADAIDRALGKPEAVDLVRTYRLSDGSKVDFQLVEDKPIQIIACLKSRAETPQQALKYLGIDIGDDPPRTQNDQEAIWRLVVDGRLLELGIVKNSAMTLCSDDILRATPRGSWVMVRVVRLKGSHSTAPAVSPEQNIEQGLPSSTGSPTPSTPANREAKTISSGKAINLPEPDYPAGARNVNALGEVDVEVTIDESGAVTSARATSGHALLRKPAEQAALRARFSPTLVAGRAVKASRIVTYNFER